MNHRPTVFIVDDDLAMRQSIAMAVRAAGLCDESYRSAEDFLAGWKPEIPGCLVLDVRMPGMSGLRLQQTLAQRAQDIPIVFISGHGDISLCVEAMKAGAVDFLEKPFDKDRMLQCIRLALAIDQQAREQREQRAAVLERYQLLTGREREILRLLVAGHSTKEISAELHISTKTVDNHRANVLRKMSVENLVDLARLAVTYHLAIHPET